MSQSLSLPVLEFSGLALRPELQQALAALGFKEPRPIQVATIPEALAGRDILGLAQTGTGKTAAFLLPLLQRVLATPRPDAAGPRVLVLAPTRELARQIADEAARLARFTRVRVATAFGGVPIGPQIAAQRSRPEILVACPGRLLDLVVRRAIRLQSVEALVVDEADHMFDMGFLPDVMRIAAMLSADRQSLLFSATMPGAIRTLAERVLRNPHVAEIAPSRPVETIEHAIYDVGEASKLLLLEHLARGSDFASGIVFTRTKHRARRLAEQLERSGFRAVALQGNMSQGQRDRAMQSFRAGRHDILVATDIAARGIDVSQVSHVVNFDMPQTPDAYTHRIGRTGRAGREGRACSFVTNADNGIVRAIERLLGRPIPRGDVPGIAPRVETKRAAAGVRQAPAPSGQRRAYGSSRRRPGRAR